jgi:very-short-patch-repair endonuclease
VRVPAEVAVAGVTVSGVCAERHHSDEVLHTPGDLAVAAHATRQHGTVSTAADDPHITRSKLEERFLGLISDARLPRPKTNTMVGGHEVDFFWPEHRLIVETDGAATHLTRRAFEDDRRRDADLTILGYRVVRITRRQVAADPRATIATLVLLLAGAG